ncbi:hypothetical protein ABW21_db0202921 [Orbilia brochopaga]|nr:hypothetical protein ABW21_db0202921 [Drechslerella brochopaga]
MLSPSFNAVTFANSAIGFLRPVANSAVLFAINFWLYSDVIFPCTGGSVSTYPTHGTECSIEPADTSHSRVGESTADSMFFQNPCSSGKRLYPASSIGALSRLSSSCFS